MPQLRPVRVNNMGEITDMNQIAGTIWETGNYINNCLLSLARRDIAEDSCLLDTLSSKQGKMVLAVKELNALHPGGCSLKKLARHLGISEPSASVMVNALVKREVLQRLTSDSDRREVKIQLTDRLAVYFANIDRAIYRNIINIGELHGRELLIKWQDLLRELARILDSQEAESSR